MALGKVVRTSEALGREPFPALVRTKLIRHDPAGVFQPLVDPVHHGCGSAILLDYFGRESPALSASAYPDCMNRNANLLLNLAPDNTGGLRG